MSSTSFDKVMAAHSSASQYGETFVDFTNELVSGVIATLVKSGMDQMTSYAELIQAISVGQSTFQQNVTGLNSDEDSTHGDNTPILDAYITDVFAGMVLPGPITQLEADGLIDHFNGVTIGTGPSRTMSDVLGTTLNITQAQLREFVYNKLLSAASKNYDTLVTLVREGWIKILPTNWKVSTDLNFHITGEDKTSIASTYYKQKARGWNARHSSGIGFNLGKFLSIASTNTASAAGSMLRVSTQTKSSTSTLTSDVLFKGHVSVSGTAVQHPSVTITPTE